MWRIILSAVLASLIIISANLLIPIAPVTVPIIISDDRPVAAPSAPVKQATSTPAVASAKVTAETVEVDATNRTRPVVRDQQVTIKVILTNRGSVETKYKPELFIDGKSTQMREIQLLPGSQEHIFTVNIPEFGKHKVSMGEKVSNFRIVESGLPTLRQDTKYATFVYNRGMEDVLEASTKNIEIAYTKIYRQLYTKQFLDKLTVYIYATNEDTAAGISTISNQPAIAERFLKYDILPEPIDDVMHTGSGDLRMCLNLFTSWMMKRIGFHTPTTAWLETGIAEFISYYVAIDYDDYSSFYKARIQRLKKAMEEDKLIPLSDLENHAMWAMKIEDKDLRTLMHDESFAMVLYMINKWEMRDMLSIFRTQLRGSTTQEALYKITGLYYLSLESTVKAWIKRLK